MPNRIFCGCRRVERFDAPCERFSTQKMAVNISDVMPRRNFKLQAYDNISQQAMSAVNDEIYDVVIVGGGIAGMATAIGLIRRGVTQALALEKATSIPSARRLQSFPMVYSTCFGISLSCGCPKSTRILYPHCKRLEGKCDWRERNHQVKSVILYGISATRVSG